MLPVLAASLAPVCLPADSPSMVVLVDSGVPTDQALVLGNWTQGNWTQGNWTQGDGELAGHGLAGIVEGSVKLPFRGDFIATGPGLATQLPSGRITFSPFHIAGVLSDTPVTGSDLWTIQ